jgi:hypothetical protein
VVDKHDLLGPEQALGDGERADLVFGDDTARIPDHVRIPFFEAEERVGIEAGIHAGYDGDALRGRERQLALVEVGRVALGVFDQLVDDAHVLLQARFTL